MDDSQRTLRHAAAEAFSQSLAQLAICFEPEATHSVAQPSEIQPAEDQDAVAGETPAPFQVLEEAAVDIEQLFKQPDDRG